MQYETKLAFLRPSLDQPAIENACWKPSVEHIQLHPVIRFRFSLVVAIRKIQHQHAYPNHTRLQADKSRLEATVAQLQSELRTVSARANGQHYKAEHALENASVREGHLEAEVHRLNGLLDARTAELQRCAACWSVVL